jgi:hypothetical protein
MADPIPQNYVVGTSVMYVTVTLPSLTGTGSLLSNLILSGTDSATATTPTTGNYDSIIGVMLKGHTASYHYGGGASTGTLNVTVTTGSNVSEPCVNWHRMTYVKNSASGTQTATAVCILK